MECRIVVDESLPSDQIILNCKCIDETVKRIEELILEATNLNIICYKDHRSYYLRFDEILYYEAIQNDTYAHSSDKSYKTRHHLCQLEKTLPKNFIRISKSAIVNINHVHSIGHSSDSSNVLNFNGSDKIVYISRRYAKSLKQSLERGRNYEK